MGLRVALEVPAREVRYFDDIVIYEDENGNDVQARAIRFVPMSDRHAGEEVIGWALDLANGASLMIDATGEELVRILRVA